jgi:predicted RNase H-like nuclease
MKNTERDYLKEERATLFDLFQGMIGFLKMAEDSYNYRINQILQKELKNFDWKIFEETTQEARDIQSEANKNFARIWEIDHILMSNPNTREIMKSGRGGIVGAKLRAKQIEKQAKEEIAIAQRALDEWNARVEKVVELKKIWSK